MKHNYYRVSNLFFVTIVALLLSWEAGAQYHPNQSINLNPKAVMDMIRYREHIHNASNATREIVDKTEHVVLAAHRGLWLKDQCPQGFYATENSWGAVKHAAHHGYEMVELDINSLSWDGELVLSHDINIGRVTYEPSPFNNTYTGQAWLDESGYTSRSPGYNAVKLLNWSNSSPDYIKTGRGVMSSWSLKPPITGPSDKNMSHGEKMSRLNDILDKMYANNTKIVIMLDLKSMEALQEAWKVVQRYSTGIYENKPIGAAWDWVIFKLPGNRWKVPDGYKQGTTYQQRWDVEYFEQKMVSATFGPTKYAVLTDKFKFVPVAYDNDIAEGGTISAEYRKMLSKEYCLYFEINVKTFNSNYQMKQLQRDIFNSSKKSIGAYHVVYDDVDQGRRRTWQANGFEKSDALHDDVRAIFHWLTHRNVNTNQYNYFPQSNVVITDKIFDARKFLRGELAREYDGNGNYFINSQGEGNNRNIPKQYVNSHQGGCYNESKVGIKRFNNCSSPSLKVRLPSIEESIVSGDKVTIFPNPAKNEVTLEFSSEERTNGQLFVTSLLGSVVLEEEINIGMGENTIPISVSSLAPGLYICRIKYGATTVETKLVVEN